MTRVVLLFLLLAALAAPGASFAAERPQGIAYGDSPAQRPVHLKVNAAGKGGSQDRNISARVGEAHKGGAELEGSAEKGLHRLVGGMFHPAKTEVEVCGHISSKSMRRLT